VTTETRQAVPGGSASDHGHLINDPRLPAMQPRKVGDPFRYGVYLVPDARTCRAVTEVTTQLRAQFGLVSAGAFPPHATLVGRQHLRLDEDEIISRITTALANVHSFDVHNAGAVQHGRGFVFDVNHREDGSVNEPFHDLARRIQAAVAPLRINDPGSPTNDFDPRTFSGHLSLASHDLFTRPDLTAEVGEYIKELEIPVPSYFKARKIALYRTESRDWAGRWWTNMTWEHVRTWNLG
jgi:hypothetical protein